MFYVCIVCECEEMWYCIDVCVFLVCGFVGVGW